MKILWINPIGTGSFDGDIHRLLKRYARDGTEVEVVSLPEDRPRHLNYHAFEGIVVGDIVRIVYALAMSYDAFIIGCFYDTGLEEARDVSARAVVVAPCQASLVFVSHLGKRFSVLVSSRKCIPKMTRNIHMYGFGGGLASMRSLDTEVGDFQSDKEMTAQRLFEEGKKAVADDGAEVLILGCTIQYGFHEAMQKELHVPVVDPVLAAFKAAEMLAESARAFGWYPSRLWGSSGPPPEETAGIVSLREKAPIGRFWKNPDGGGMHRGE
jgi:allantoin racemase